MRVPMTYSTYSVLLVEMYAKGNSHGLPEETPPGWIYAGRASRGDSDHRHFGVDPVPRLFKRERGRAEDYLHQQFETTRHGRCHVQPGFRRDLSGELLERR